MAKPRLLLVAQITELEWRIKPLLEEWADVASYDPPGVGDEPPADPLDVDALVARGLAEIDRRGWERCFITGDEFASALALRIAEARPEAVEGLALGHACLSYAEEGADAPIDGGVMAGFRQLLQTDYRSWVRAYTQITKGAYDDETMGRVLERVPADVAKRIVEVVEGLVAGESPERSLRTLGAPLLFAEHRDCIVFTRESFKDAATAFPEARTVSTHEKPNCSPAFSDALRSFCEELQSATGEPARPAGR